MAEKHNRNHRRPHEPSGQYLLAALLIVGIIVILLMIKDLPNLQPIQEMPLGHLLVTVVGYLVLGCEIASAFVIGSSALHALASYIRGLVDRNYPNQLRSSERIRLRLGHRLSLALEFAVAADILKLAISPTFADLIILFAIILLRVLLNLFLEYDIKTIGGYHILPEVEEMDCSKRE